MPFSSKAQARAAFAGAIPGFSKARAKAWAKETDFSKLPDHTKKAQLHRAIQPGAIKDALVAIRNELEARERQKKSSLVMAPRVTSPALRGAKPPLATSTGKGTVTSRNAGLAKQNGEFQGRATTSGLKPVQTSTINQSLAPKTPMATSRVTAGTTALS